MTRNRRNLLLGSCVILGGLAALLLAAPLLLNTERYRGMLAARASRLLNREVNAKSLRLHLLPTPGATIRGLTVADRAPWSGSFIEADRLDVIVKLLPLFRGELQVRKILIDRPRIRLARGPEGWNLEDLIRPAERPAPTEPRSPEGTRPSRGQHALPVLLAGALSIRNATLLIESPVPSHGPARLELRNVNVDAPAPQALSPLRFHVSGRPPGDASGSFDLTGSLRFEDGDRLPVEADLKVRGLEAAPLGSYLGLPGSFAATLNGTLDLEAKAAGDWPRIEVQAEVDLQGVGLTLGKIPGKAPGEKARLVAKTLWDGDAFDMRDASLRWKDQTITGRLHLANFQSPRVRFELNAPNLVIEPLAAIASALGSGTSLSSTSRAPRPSPLTPHRSNGSTRSERSGGLDVQGRLRSGAVHWGGLVLTAAEGELRYAGGLLALRRLRGTFYGGSLSGDAAFDWRGQLPHTSITARLEGVQTEPVLKALQGDRWKLVGMMTLDSTLDLAGQPGSGGLSRASGHSDMVVTGGRLTGYPPLEKVAQTFDPFLKGAGLSSTLNEFDRLSAHWTLDAGTLRTKDLLLEREGAKLMAAGSMNLQDQNLDFSVTARVAKATLEATVRGTPSSPVVTPQLGRIEQRVKTEVGKIMKGERGEALGKVLRQLIPR